ncbi:PAS domain S-box protein [uncultured Methanocorpusculum sp.]|nr:PAS domain S-box protein [uncultured Methanocorpusculum sp.]
MVEQTGEFSEILTLLRENPRGMSVTEIADATHLNRNTIARYMDNLLVSGRVEMRTFGKAKVFFLSKRVPVSAMLNLSSEMVLLIDADLKVIQANESLVSFLSAEADDIVGKYVYDSACKTFCNDVLTDQIRAALQGETVRSELRLLKNGTNCYLDQRIYPMVLPDGRPGVTVVWDDITENVNSADALEQSEAMFRRLVETIHDVIWSLDENFCIQYISPQIANVTGYSPEELTGRQFSEFMPAGAAARFNWELASAVSRENGFMLPEFPFICKDKRKIYCEFSGSPVLLEEESIFLGYNGALRDVTDRRDAELGAKRWKRFLDGVMNNIPAIITVIGMESREYYYVNKSAEKFLQLSKNELSQMTSKEILAKIGSVRLTEAHDTVALTSKEARVSEDRIVVNGETRYISAQVIPMNLSVDRQYLLTIVNDITEEDADRQRQMMSRELAFILEGVSSTKEMWDPLLDMLPNISGFESVGVYQLSIFDDYTMFRSRNGRFAPAIHTNSMIHRIIRKGEPVIFDKHRMRLLPENTVSPMDQAKSLVIMPVIFEGRTVACVILGSKTALAPDTVRRTLLLSTTFQISTVASRCLVLEKLQRERDRTRSYLDVAGDLLVAVNRDGNVEMLNKYGTKILGYTEAELMGRNWFTTVIPEKARQRRIDGFQKLIAGNFHEDDYVYEGVVRCKDGTEKTLRWRNTPLHEECGSIAGIVSSGEVV